MSQDGCLGGWGHINQSSRHILLTADLASKGMDNLDCEDVQEINVLGKFLLTSHIASESTELCYSIVGVISDIDEVSAIWFNHQIG